MSNKMQPLVAVNAKPAATSKTLIVAVLTVLVGLSQLVTDNFQLPANYLAIITTAVGAITFVLRLLTKQPVTLSTENKPELVEAPKP